MVEDDSPALVPFLSVLEKILRNGLTGALFFVGGRVGSPDLCAQHSQVKLSRVRAPRLLELDGKPAEEQCAALRTHARKEPARGTLRTAS